MKFNFNLIFTRNVKFYRRLCKIPAIKITLLPRTIFSLERCFHSIFSGINKIMTGYEQ